MSFVGIDPGLSGALAFLGMAEDGTIRTLQVRDMPIFTITNNKHKRREIDTQSLAQAIRLWAPHLVVVERVHSMPGQGVASSFTFGQGYGEIRGVTAALALPVEFVGPRVWKKALGVTSDKDTSRRAASMLFPRHAAYWSRKKDDGRAEAALLAWYGWRRMSKPIQ